MRNVILISVRNLSIQFFLTHNPVFYPSIEKSLFGERMSKLSLTLVFTMTRKNAKGSQVDTTPKHTV